MNNVFSKNISALMQKNSELAQKLLVYIPTEVPQLIHENNTYNFLYKGQFIHNKDNPLGEALEIFSRAENSPVSIHLIYGLGLGYLFQVASERSKGTVILYEPDLNILRVAFMFVDFSNDILKKNVIIVDDYKSVSEAIYKCSNTQNTPELLSVVSQRNYDQDKFNTLVHELQNLVGSYNLDLKYTKKNFYLILKYLLYNIPNLVNEIPLNRLKDIYKGKTAVVCSAGPTLDKNIEVLKKYRNRYVLFAVGTAVKALYEKGVKPDFLCIIESYDSSKQIEGLDLSDVNFITEPYSNPKLRKFNFKKTYLHISANTPINHFWADVSGENIEEYWSKGTVSYTALNSARLLGCSKIILVGQDLAYIDGQCYSKDSAYKDLVCGLNPETNAWEIMAKDFDAFVDAISASPDKETREKAARYRLKTLNASLYTVKGINGNMLPTESVYAAFVKPLSEYVEYFNDRKYINTSLVGAQIDGFENISLEKALMDDVEFSKDIACVSFSNDKDLIVSNIKKRIETLKIALKIIEEGKQILKSIKNNLKRTTVLNPDILKTLKKLSVLYLNLSTEFVNKSMLFDFITVSEKIDIDYEMKMTQNLTIEGVNRLVELFASYFNNAEVRIAEVERLVNESLNTKS